MGGIRARVHLVSEDAAALNKRLTFFLMPETIDESLLLFFDLEGLSDRSSLGMGLSSLLVRSITDDDETVISAAFLGPFPPLLTTFKGVLFVVSAEGADAIVDINFVANSDW